MDASIQTSADTSFATRKAMPFITQWRFLALIFVVMLVWQITAQLINMPVPSETYRASDRAVSFALTLIYKLSIFVFFWGIVTLVRLSIEDTNPSLITGIKVRLHRSRITDPTRLKRGTLFFIVAIISFVFLQTNFMMLKTAIPDYLPFYLDEAAQKLDKALFFGRAPYTYFEWLYDIPAAVKLIDRTYTYWAALIAGIWLYCFTSERMARQRRYQYIFAMILIWIIAGNILAFILSSAGPCYYAQFTGDSTTYAPLMQTLDAINTSHVLNAFEYQGILLDMHNTPGARVGGISAMPSLHVGTSLMMLLLFWKTRIARELLIAFNITIYIGSIVLGWHYAIDGLIVIPVVFLCWWLGGKISAYIETLSQPKPQH